ncbi:MAG: hypothetical protein DDT19_01049 [Syntrophomonadaceae bacterium]|nr:hypothetical protein [Bacillota bacterium]
MNKSKGLYDASQMKNFLQRREKEIKERGENDVKGKFSGAGVTKLASDTIESVGALQQYTEGSVLGLMRQVAGTTFSIAKLSMDKRKELKNVRVKAKLQAAEELIEKAGICNRRGR